MIQGKISQPVKENNAQKNLNLQIVCYGRDSSILGLHQCIKSEIEQFCQDFQLELWLYRTRMHSSCKQVPVESAHCNNHPSSLVMVLFHSTLACIQLVHRYCSGMTGNVAFASLKNKWDAIFCSNYMLFRI